MVNITTCGISYLTLLGVGKSIPLSKTDVMKIEVVRQVSGLLFNTCILPFGTNGRGFSPHFTLLS